MAQSTWQRFKFLSAADALEEGTNSSEGWIQWFCSLDNHEFLCEVDEDYIRDSFNLYGLKTKVKDFDRALEMILGAELTDDDDLVEADSMEVYRAAIELYALIHARFIVTTKGLSLMNDKFIEARFGFCPRVYCKEQRVLPMGLTDQTKMHYVYLYCPCCQECYTGDSRLDGGFFGPYFPAVFLQAYPSWVPLAPPIPFVPKIFGFRVHKKRSIIQVKIDKTEYGWQAARELGSAACLELLPNSSEESRDSSDSSRDKMSHHPIAQNM